MESLVNGYHYLNYELADKQMVDWFWVGSYFPILTVTIVYLYFIKIAGPRFMKNRQPYDLKLIMTLYNIFQIFSCLVLIKWLYYAGFHDGSFTIKCKKITTIQNPSHLNIAFYTFFIKIVDLTDTIFFVLRKKYNQITFLHVYHHLSMIWVPLLGVKYNILGSMVAFPSMVNFSVHTIMYAYYLITGLGKEYQEIMLPIKKYITRLQLIQFVIIILHYSQVFLPMCADKGLKTFGYVLLTNVFIYFILFYRFYKKAYNKSKNI